MKHILVPNVNHALAEGFWHLHIEGVPEDSRNGDVLVAPGPVMTEYIRPWERVLFNPVRDANPTFHLMESIWMLAGRNDLAFLEPFNSRFKQFAEQDGIVHGAYGHRWREAFGHDQIYTAIEMLRAHPDTRRVVIQMWSCDLDLGEDKRDLPCNTHIYLDLRGGKLNMTVCNRSNDILWGAYGANAVHMSMLQELIAAAVGVPMGFYRQFSNNFHAYLDAPNVKDFLEVGAAVVDPYASGLVGHQSMIGYGERFESFLLDCIDFCEGREHLRTRFMNDIVVPMADMYLARKDGDKVGRFDSDSSIDWHVSYNEWADRRDS